MDKEKARAIAAAILQPDLAVQAQLAQRRQVEQRYLRQKRGVAIGVLVGAGIGLIIATLLGERFTLGVLYGGLPGALVAWCIQRIRARPAVQT